MRLSDDELVTNAGELLQMKWKEVCQRYCDSERLSLAIALIDDHLSRIETGIFVSDFRSLYKDLLNFICKENEEGFKGALFSCMSFEVNRGVGCECVPIGENDLM